MGNGVWNSLNGKFLKKTMIWSRTKPVGLGSISKSTVWLEAKFPSILLIWKEKTKMAAKNQNSSFLSTHLATSKLLGKTRWLVLLIWKSFSNSLMEKRVAKNTTLTKIKSSKRVISWRRWSGPMQKLLGKLYCMIQIPKP